MDEKSPEVQTIKRESVPSHVTRPYDFSDEGGVFIDLADQLKSLWPLPAVISTTAWLAYNWSDIITHGSKFYPYISPDITQKKPIFEQIQPFLELVLYAGIPLALGGMFYAGVQMLKGRFSKERIHIRTPRPDPKINIRNCVEIPSDTKELFPFLYEGIDNLSNAGTRKRRLFGETHNWLIKPLKDRLRKKDIVSQISCAYLDYLTNSYGDAIERMDRMMEKRQNYSPERLENADFYRISAKLMRSISKDSRIYRGRAIRREQWFIEQMYLDALSDNSISIDSLTDSKHDVRVIRSNIPTDEIIKRYRGDDPSRSQEGEITFTRQIRDICGKDQTAPRLLTAIKLIEERKEDYVSIFSMLKGETLNKMISRLGGGHPQVQKAAERAMNFMGMIYSMIPPSMNGLKRRDHESYVRLGMKNANVNDLITGLDLETMLAPVNYSESRGIQVTCKDPHAGNWGMLIDGRIASYDNELSHSVALPGEIAKFFLFSFDPRYDASPGDYDDPVYSGYANTILDSFNEHSEIKAEWDEDFYLDIKNFEILQGISLYSPYTLRQAMKEKKRDILFKARDAIEIIKGNYRESAYQDHKEGYNQLFELVRRMIKRNGF